jgi:hypothetical protein
MTAGSWAAGKLEAAMDRSWLGGEVEARQNESWAVDGDANEAEGAGGWIRFDIFSFFAFWIHCVHRHKATKYWPAKARRSLRSKNIGRKIGALLIPNYPVCTYVTEKLCNSQGIVGNYPMS